MGSDEDMAVGFQPILSSNGQRTAEPSGAFTLDTSGMVRNPTGLASGRAFLRWTDLTPFRQGYVRALFASLAHLRVADPTNVREECRRVAFRDLSPEALAGILRDCEAYRAQSPGLSDIEYQGQLFWNARQVGRWSSFRPLTPHLADDGKIRFAPPPQGVNATGAEAFPDNHLNEGA